MATFGTSKKERRKTGVEVFHKSVTLEGKVLCRAASHLKPFSRLFVSPLTLFLKVYRLLKA
jgi:hypothetical protein